jgi:hypothetical protein
VRSEWLLYTRLFQASLRPLKLFQKQTHATCMKLSDAIIGFWTFSAVLFLFKWTFRRLDSCLCPQVQKPALVDPMGVAGTISGS